jgi:hypothetical protein
MAHERAEIRDKVRALIDNATDARCFVYKGRVSPTRRNRLPYVLVQTPGEGTDEDEAKSSAPRRSMRNLTVVIEAEAEESGGRKIDDIIDDLALQIENAVSDPYLDGTAFNSWLSSSDIEISDESTRVTGKLTLTYTVQYEAYRPATPSDASLDDFNRFGSTYNLSNETDPGDVAEDLTEIPE